MTIATRLKLNILLSAVVVLIMSLAFATAFMVVKRASDRVSFSDRLSSGMFDLSILTEYYVKYPEERPKEQWHIKYEAISKSLQDAAEQPEQKDLARNMARNLDDLSVLFQELSATYENTLPGKPGEKPDRLMMKAKQEQLSDLIMSRLREIAGITERISMESADAIRETNRNISLLFSLFAALILILAIRFSLRMKRVITEPISRLRQGTEIIRAGDLDHRIPITAEDELGQLSNSFNEMTGYLKESTVSRNELMAEIQERRAAQEELHKSRAQLETITENLAEGLIASGLDGSLFYWNRAAIEMHGFSSPEEWQRKLPEFSDTFELSTLEGAVLPLDQWPMSRILRGEFLRDLPLCIRRIGSDWERICSYGGTLVRDASGRPMMAVLTVSDVTERIKAEEEIRRFTTELECLVEERTAKLESANRELEAFSYSVSHDLRAPLRAIEGFSRILEEDYRQTLDDEGKRVLSVIVSNTKNMSKLIDDLLAFSRVGRYELKHSLLDMEAMVRAVLDEIVPAGDRQKISITVRPLEKAVGDASLIKQVWANLLSNAVKFSSRKEHPCIEVGGRETDGAVLYYVKDNGAGFDMAYANKLFGVFQRLHSAKEFEGTGVGLAIAQRIVNRHGGRIWAEASPEQGATFFFTLPANGAGKA